MKIYKKYIYFLIALIILDQLTKYLVHTYMKFGYIGEIKVLGKWLRLHYTLNPGMAFGLKIGTKYGKLILSIIRLVATYFIAFRVIPVLPKKNTLVITGWIMILAGAIGNIIDSVLYGFIYNNAPVNAPFRLFYGQVIDMILVGIENIRLPNFFPWVGGKYLPPFPVFNIADSCISTGVLFIFLKNFYDKFVTYFKNKKTKKHRKTL